MSTVRGWTLAQRFAIAIGLFTAVAGAIGLIINPDVAVGDNATAERFIVSWNGWHGVIALVAGLPGLAVAWLPRWAVPYLLYRGHGRGRGPLGGPRRPTSRGVLFLPTSGDATLHVLLAVVAVAGLLLARRAPSARDERHARITG